MPRVILTVAVFDEDCYDLCDETLNKPCIQKKCQSIRDIGPDSGIFIKGNILSKLLVTLYTMHFTPIILLKEKNVKVT